MLPEFSTNTTLTINQVVYAGGKINYAKKAASSLLEIQISQRELTVSEVVLKTETAYWQLVNMKEKKVLAEGYIKLLNSLHNDLNNSYKAGLIYKNDMLRVGVQLNQAELNLTKALDGITMAKLNLAQLTGLNHQIYG
ncbi:TolC family protein [Pedobacter sp. NJ-S-72]